MSRMNWSAGFRSTNRALLQNPLPIGKKPNTKRNSIPEGGLIPEWSPFSGKEHNIGTYILDRTGQISGTVRDYHRPSKGVGSSRTSGLYLSGGLWISEKYIIHGQGGHRPVSYTHLDVYKRQDEDDIPSEVIFMTKDMA